MAGRGYSSQMVADYIIAKGGGTLTPLHVIKLAYISHGYTLASLDLPLVNESVQAWRYGPVFPSMYFRLRDYGSAPIRALDYCGTDVHGDGLGKRLEFFEGIMDEERCKIIETTIGVYGKLSANKLVTITHADDTPWKRYYRPGVFNTVIPDEDTKAYYEKIIGK